MKRPLESDAGSSNKHLPGAQRCISDSQWQAFFEQGFVNLGRVIPDELLQRMDGRAVALMKGEVDHGDKLMMQVDPGGAYNNSVASCQQTAGHKGPTMKYRKIGEAGWGLECDDVFRETMTLPVFREMCAELHGAHTDIAVYRAMLFNKPAEGGTDLPWHQDGGDWWGLDRDPLVFVWTAIDAATRQNGCVQVVPGSHRLGLLSRRGHTLSDQTVSRLEVDARAVNVEVDRGETVMMHNFLVHRSGLNPTDKPRRAFSVNYADGRTCLLDPRPVVQPEGKSASMHGFKIPGQRL
eukprot:CAMPEP_0203840450 /NCGR_PEP_ID=MMETSP0359-20131031/785_1 /ASSEMBLY_ACC=CAM_ASM_000338 /TAXON_ID=268821 /ORGANISM="Scrippsiella Hangoei, Strain SHTV-5" /LENGTH=293 /DNA_ID=CAMNT_0050754665 /DNA_START=52 /DNA_END=930 /DNA_ORIENTATION=-